MTKANTLSLRIKNKLRNYPLFYEVCRFILSSCLRFYPAKRNRFLKELLRARRGKILNIGSGYIPGFTGTSESIINTDLFYFKGVNVISDAHQLSFGSQKFEAAILESILEHTADPVLVVKEASRVLKKEGIIFVEAPFLYEFHSAPFDYYRFSLPGIETLLKDFEKIESGISAGPTGALTSVLRNYFAIIFSFNNTVLYELLNVFFGIVLFPFKFLDFFIIRFKNAGNISSVFYFIGKKK